MTPEQMQRCSESLRMAKSNAFDSEAQQRYDEKIAKAVRGIRFWQLMTFGWQLVLIVGLVAHVIMGH